MAQSARPRFLKRPEPETFVFPGPRDRVAIFGETGSGKTVFGFWLFAQSADFERKPWLLVDYKGDDIMRELLRMKLITKIKPTDDVPRKPGVYIVQPEPHEQDEMVALLWRIYKQGNIGVFFDELSMIPEIRGDRNSGGPLKAILTQGRSKEIPVYGCTQRPVDINKHMFTEAQYFAVFWLKARPDRIRVMEYLPDDNAVFADINKKLPPHWCRWYDHRRDVALRLKPVPKPISIIDTIRERIEELRDAGRL